MHKMGLGKKNDLVREMSEDMKVLEAVFERTFNIQPYGDVCIPVCLLALGCRPCLISHVISNVE